MLFIVVGAAGRMGSLHAKHLIELGHTVLSVDYPNGKDAFISTYDWCGIEADGVVIATPAEQHAADVNTVLAAGQVKHIFVEKPLCLVKQLSGMRKMVMDAKQNGVTIHVGYNLRCHPAVQGLISARKQERMKRILHASFVLRQIPKRTCAHFREEWASHEVDLALYLLGKDWVRVTGATWLPVEPQYECAIRHHGGAVSSIYVDGYYEPNVRSITLVDEAGNCFHRDIEANHVREEHYREELRGWVAELSQEGHGDTTLATGDDGLAAINVFNWSQQ